MRGSSVGSYVRLDDNDGTCCLLHWRKAKTKTKLDSLVTYDKLVDKARELDMLREGVKFEMTELTLEAQKHVEEGDRDMAVACLQQRHTKKKRYQRLVKMWNNCNLVAEKLQEAALYQKFSLALAESNQALDYLLERLDYEEMEELMDKIEDNSAEVSEVGDLLSRPHHSLETQLQLDVEAELAQLEEHHALLQTADLPDISLLGVENQAKQTKGDGRTKDQKPEAGGL